jgi:hypothetical protein
MRKPSKKPAETHGNMKVHKNNNDKNTTPIFIGLNKKKHGRSKGK